MSAADVIYIVLVSLAGALVFNTLINIDVNKAVRARRRLRQFRRVRAQRTLAGCKAREAELRLPQLHREREALEAKVNNALRHYTNSEDTYRKQLSAVIAAITEAEGWLSAAD